MLLGGLQLLVHCNNHNFAESCKQGMVAAVVGKKHNYYNWNSFELVKVAVEGNNPDDLLQNALALAWRLVLGMGTHFVVVVGHLDYRKGKDKLDSFVAELEEMYFDSCMLAHDLD